MVFSLALATTYHHARNSNILRVHNNISIIYLLYLHFCNDGNNNTFTDQLVLTYKKTPIIDHKN